MIKISRTEAYWGLDEFDMKVIDQELDSLVSQAKNAGKEMSIQYFLEDEETITLKVYWDGKEVETFRFINKTKPTETALKKLNKDK